MRKLPPEPVLLVVLAGLGMVGPFTIDTMFPAFTQMSADLGVGNTALQQVVSSYLIAFAAMSLFHGPISDAVGRKPVIVVGSLVFIAASVLCALAPSLQWLIVGRLLQGASAGAGQIISRAMVPDLFGGFRAQRVMSHIAMIFGLAPALAPVFGGWLLLHGSWRIIFWFLVGFGVLLVGLTVLVLPETHPAENRTPLSVRTVLGNLVRVWRTPIGRRLSIGAAFNFAGMFLYIGSSSLFMVELLGKGEQDFWILFVPLIGGMVLGAWVAGRLAGRVDDAKLATTGFGIALAGGGANLLFALLPATRAQLPWSVVALPVLSFGVAIAFPILTVNLLTAFPEVRGAASSVQTFVSLTLNAVLAGAIAPLVGTSLAGLATTAIGFSLIGLLIWRRHLAATTDWPS